MSKRAKITLSQVKQAAGPDVERLLREVAA